MITRRLVLGLTLLGASAPPLVLLAREQSLTERLDSSYELRQLLSDGLVIGPRRTLEKAPASLRVAALAANRVEIRFAGRSIEVSDELGPGAPEAGPASAPVRIQVDGKDWSSPAAVEILAGRTGLDRYHGWLAVWLLTRLETRTTRLGVIQRVDGATLLSRRGGWRFRVLWMGDRPEVEEEAFGLADRRTPPYRLVLLNSVVPMSVGAYTETVPMVSLFSFVYPWLTAVAGLGLIGLELASRLHERHQGGHHRGPTALPLNGPGR